MNLLPYQAASLVELRTEAARRRPNGDRAREYIWR